MKPIFDPRRGSARPSGVPYHYDDELAIAITVALAAGRPLLLRGNPGTGKSTLARDAAWCLDRRYEAEVITSRTQAQDLQWRFDAVRRLADIQAEPGRKLGGEHDAPYVEPGVLWRAFDPADAAAHGARRVAGAPVDTRGVVVLLDEIDKADPDVPNDLLVVLDEQWFRVTETGHVVRRAGDVAMFLILTTNRERELPAAFLRRCVVFDLEDPGPDVMKTIARLHHARDPVPEPDVPAAERPPPFEDLLQPLWDALVELRKRAAPGGLRAPTTAEYLDALNACLAMGIRDAGDARWRRVIEATMWKHAPPGKAG